MAGLSVQSYVPLLMKLVAKTSAAHTFQDHLFSGWLGKKAEADLARFLKGASDGTLSAEWKDEVWAREHQPGARPAKR